MVTRDEAKKISFFKEVDRQGNIKRVFIPHELRPESLTNIRDGRSYLEAGSNVTIDSSSLGPITISSTTGSSGGAPTDASYVVVSLDGALSDERRLQAGTGLLLEDGGANGDLTLVSDDSVVATISGSQFSGVTIHTAGLSGSLTQLSDGNSYLEADDNITIVSESNGPVTISSTAASLSKTILTASYHDLTHDPVALWQFSGSLVDETANGFDLNLQAGTERYTHMAPGMLGAQFDNATWFGRDATDTLLLITGSMTVEAIFMIPNVPGGELHMVEMAENGESLPTNILFRVATETSNTPQWEYFAEEGAGTNISFTTSSYNAPIGRAFHFAMTRASDTNVVKFYVDGQLAVSSSNLNTAAYGGTPTQKLNVGRTRAQSLTTRRSAIASLKIISGSALDATQVREEYERSLGTLYRLE